jgi:hypothetical protein
MNNGVCGLAIFDLRALVMVVLFLCQSKICTVWRALDTSGNTLFYSGYTAGYCYHNHWLDNRPCHRRYMFVYNNATKYYKIMTPENRGQTFGVSALYGVIIDLLST